MSKKKSSKFNYIISIIVLIMTIVFIYTIYRVNNFNDFQRSERIIGTSKFKRDNQVKYSEKDSYEIISEQYNDAMFYKKIQVKQNTPYKVKCMVKTEDVIAEDENKAIRCSNFNQWNN